MNLLFAVLVAVLLITGAWWMYRSEEAAVAPNLVEDVQAGAHLFATNCAICHGTDVMGSVRGPPLVHKLYEPSHHPDAAFFRAVSQGVVSHHWSFGDMPPIPGISQRDVGNIVAYVRDLQRSHGIR